MKGRTILLDHIGGREAAALMVDGQLDELLIDGDATGQGLSLALGVTGRPGLAQVATEGMPLAEAVVTLPVTGLELLPSIRPGGPATQPSAARMSRLLSAARAVAHPQVSRSIEPARARAGAPHRRYVSGFNGGLSKTKSP